MDSPPRRRARRPPLALAAGLVLVGLAGLVWYVGPGRGGDPTGAATIDQDAAARPTRAPDPTAGTSGSEVTGAPRSAEGAQGRGATTGPPAPAPACERVLSTGDAAAALGRPVARVQARDGRFVRACLFWDGGDDRYLLVQLQQGPTASRAAFRLGRRPVDRPVAGVGKPPGGSRTPACSTCSTAPTASRSGCSGRPAPGRWPSPRPACAPPPGPSPPTRSPPG
jgi:hypothetical protein